MNILYLVHDLSDAGVKKRTAMMRDGGAQVRVAGFRRSEQPPADVSGAPAVDWGRTYNGGFVQRVAAVLREIIGLKKHRALFVEVDIIVARNLEMLALAVRGRGLCKTPPVIVYESIDIHRLLLNNGPVGIVLRALEGWLSRRASALITSSPAFIDNYFKPRSRVDLPIKLVENKVYMPGVTVARNEMRSAGPPWRIGWFGALRCAKSLKILSDLARESAGRIEVIIRGKPSYDQMPDFDRVVGETPGVTYAGPYRYPDDLAVIYGDVHFTWAIDMFEEGLNSTWLLPNRIYEGGLYGCVPLAQSHVETGRLLTSLGTGVQLDEPLADSVRAFFNDVTPDHYRELAKAAQGVPVSRWLCGPDEGREFVSWLENLKRENGHG
ncbi:MAG: glycosyl transferase family 1 [Rhodospirillales bacterium]|nr:glycosyl transferase family 1 [Rhodospirillales bacterium]